MLNSYPDMDLHCTILILRRALCILFHHAVAYYILACDSVFHLHNLLNKYPTHSTFSTNHPLNNHTGITCTINSTRFYYIPFKLLIYELFLLGNIYLDKRMRYRPPIHHLVLDIPSHCKMDPHRNANDFSFRNHT